MKRRLSRHALVAVAAIAAAIGLTLVSPAVSSSAQVPTSVETTAAVPGRWVIYDTYPSEGECKQAKAFIDTVTNLATLPVGNSCYLGEFGWYFLFWDA